MFRHDLRLCRRDHSRRSDQAGLVTLHHMSDVQTPLNKPQPFGTSWREEKRKPALPMVPALQTPLCLPVSHYLLGAIMNVLATALLKI